MDGNNSLLETRLKELRLATFVKNYRRFAEMATQKDWSFDQYLLALAEIEVAQR